MPLRPTITYFTIGGALLGVVLTVIVQMIVSWWNRRNDRRLQTFSIRMAVYARFCEHIVNVHDNKRHLTELESTMNNLEEKVHSGLTAKEKYEVTAAGDSLKKLESEIARQIEYVNGERWKIHLIASKRVREAASAVYANARLQDDVSLATFDDFLALARKEIGIAK